jgi:hypothetical protein
MKNYRKIYEKYHGSIPTEPNGRTYEIHHVDGDHTNNDPTNLVAITLQEHYDIHYAQGDYGACRLMLMQRIKHSPAEFKKIVSKQQQKRIKDGTHQFTSSDWQRENQLKIVASGKHHWTTTQHSNRVSQIQQTLIKNGKHPLQNGAVTRQQLADGKHASQIKKICEHCNTLSSSNNYNRWHGSKCKHKISV